ncbi:MAG: 50S ribosomal protein L31 [Candidatus Saccharimonadales bacterium]
MKQDIHPDYTKAIVTCNGCKTSFETRATVDKIDVEICSACHPFYTGKQKLVDVAGRVDRFRARQAAASGKSAPKTKPVDAKAKVATKNKKSLSDLKADQ